MEITLSNTLPPYPTFVEDIRRAPDRGFTLSPAQTATALKNALRYIPKELHETLAPEFMEELRTRGRIYGYRYRPQGDLKAKPIDAYKGNCIEGKAFQVMIDNNLCFDIALYPYELVTYGETGQVCQNWMQYRLIKQYLEVLTQDQTLVIESGHPLGLFRSKPDAPRVIITNAMMVGLYDNQKDWHVAMQMGVANYGQMTAGGWMYIGPQGIVHGTFNTLLNAGRMKLGIPQNGDLRGHLFISSGLGGMSGAQPKAAEMSGAASIIAEVDMSRIGTRHRQGWVGYVTDSIPEAFLLANEAMDCKVEIMFSRRYDLYVFKHPEELEEYLMDIIREICDQEQNSLKNGGNAIIRDILHYVEQNYQYDLSLQELAEKKYFMNSSYLSRLFKSAVGQTFSRYVIELRIKKARELLKDKTMKTNDVAAQVGYNNTSHFIQSFKKLCGCTPEEYRNQL